MDGNKHLKAGKVCATSGITPGPRTRRARRWSCTSRRARSARTCRPACRWGPEGAALRARHTHYDFYAALPGACTACSCVLSGCCRCACPGFEAAPRRAACACQQQNICWRLCEASCASMPCQGTRLCPDKHCVLTVTVLAHQLGQRAPGGVQRVLARRRARGSAPPHAGAARCRRARQRRHQPHAGLGSVLSCPAPTPRRQLQALDVALRRGVPCGSTITVTCRFRVRAWHQ